MPYNSSVNAPSRWVLEGTNDRPLQRRCFCHGSRSVFACRVRRCILAGAPDYQAMGDGTYAQRPSSCLLARQLFVCLQTPCRNGETLYGRSVYRDSSGARILVLSCAPKCSLGQAASCTLTMPVQVGAQLSTITPLCSPRVCSSRWVSPSIQEGGYGAIRCVVASFACVIVMVFGRHQCAACRGWNSFGSTPAHFALPGLERVLGLSRCTRSLGRRLCRRCATSHPSPIAGHCIQAGVGCCPECHLRLLGQRMGGVLVCIRA